MPSLLGIGGSSCMKLSTIVVFILALWGFFLTSASIGASLIKQDAIVTGAFTKDGKAYKVTLIEFERKEWED